MPSLNFWTGSSWQNTVAVNAWNGSAWNPANGYVWTGSVWQPFFNIPAAGTNTQIVTVASTGVYPTPAGQTFTTGFADPSLGFAIGGVVTPTKVSVFGGANTLGLYWTITNAGPYGVPSLFYVIVNGIYTQNTFNTVKVGSSVYNSNTATSFSSSPKSNSTFWGWYPTSPNPSGNPFGPAGSNTTVVFS